MIQETTRGADAGLPSIDSDSFSKALFNILDDFGEEKSLLEDTQKAMLNILEDAELEKISLESAEKATLNILADFSDEKDHLADVQSAFLNILEDIDEEKTKGDMINDRMTIEVAEHQKAEESLSRSNKELEQFAYVASHDLQEPLRMIASYVELLAQRYQGQLDERADKYIHYIVDGATRMQTLINDLLTFSRVSTRANPFSLVDAELTLSHVLTNLQQAIADKGATVTHDSMPAVMADPTQLIQLLQNLIANGLKFCQTTPQVHVGVIRQADEWLFSVRDNGIGIAKEHQNRLFVIFQRLHTRTEYPGTGIGLAVCKKVVERHGGRIWIESEPGQGSTFFFTLPIRQEQT